MEFEVILEYRQKSTMTTPPQHMTAKMLHLYKIW